MSTKAKKRQQDEMGTLGSGNHYLEVQHVGEIYDEDIAATYGLQLGNVVLCNHCGSRGLGHQIGTEFLKRMTEAAGRYGIDLPDRELACAPIESSLGEEYLGAMRAAINCALGNRQIITHLSHQAFSTVLPQAELHLLYDVSHNTCKVEEHYVEGRARQLSEFDWPFQTALDKDNRWVKLSECIPWDELAQGYYEGLPVQGSGSGVTLPPPRPLRTEQATFTALGSSLEKAP